MYGKKIPNNQENEAERKIELLIHILREKAPDELLMLNLTANLRQALDSAKTKDNVAMADALKSAYGNAYALTDKKIDVTADIKDIVDAINRLAE